jgi:hypothetical protein
MSDYDVGYGKPPKGSQFKKGQSGNPKGRPKKSVASTDMSDMVNEVSMTPVGVMQKGKKKKMPLKKAILLAIMMNGLTGDAKDKKLALETMAKYGAVSSPASIADLLIGQSPFELTAEDEANIAKFKLLKKKVDD